jgi:AraC-like DNA-binding protein
MHDRSGALPPLGTEGHPLRLFPEAYETAPLQRVGVLAEIPRLLREMNVDPDSFLVGLGVDKATLSDIEGRLPFPLVSELMLKFAEATGREDFNLIVGAAAGLRHLGIIGKLLSSAPVFRTAAADFVANHPRYVRGASTYLIDWGEDGLLIGHRVHYPGLRGSALFSAGAMAFGRVVFAELCGVEPTYALLSLPRPADLSPFKKAFGRAKLVFEAEHFGLVYSRAALAKPIPTADPVLRAEIRRFVAERWNFLQPDILDRVMRILVPLVLAGTPSLGATAEMLVMHPRTLNRALQTRGLSFRDAVNEARFEMACQLLRDTRVGIGSLARILGYSEVSAFTRFFTGMSGRSPSDWMEQEMAPRSP